LLPALWTTVELESGDLIAAVLTDTGQCVLACDSRLLDAADNGDDAAREPCQETECDCNEEKDRGKEWVLIRILLDLKCSDRISDEIYSNRIDER